MAAIWGFVKKNIIDEKYKNAEVEELINHYTIDIVDEKIYGNAYFGCGHQYICDEDKVDISPIIDEDCGIVFNGDCLLYNREKLINEIKNTSEYKDYSTKQARTLGDTELAYISYKIFGDSFACKLRGSFAFAIYNTRENKLDLFTDHLVKRYLAYYIDENAVYFGSNYQLIKALSQKHFGVNREFVVNAFQDMSPINFFKPELTPYNGIYHLENAMHVCIDIKSGDVTKSQYWNPLNNIKKLKLTSDEEYKELFLRTYSEVAISMLRSCGETGIMLSGGLDSSSVAALVAPELRKRGKKLYSYTSIPATQYEATVNSYIMENESSLIKQQQEKHPNLEPRYIFEDEKNIMMDMKEFQNLFQIPLKPSVNMSNINTMSRIAKEDGCKIFLSGSNGNPTVSYGEAGNMFSLFLLSGHPIKAISEMSKFCKVRGIPRKKYMPAWLKTFIKSKLYGPVEYSYYLKKSDQEKYNLLDTAKKHTKQFGSEYLVSEKQKNNFMYMPVQYIQKGFYYTTMGLKYGYQLLDPTLSVEMIELALSLPYDCFFKDGIDRRMVREYMKGLIPDDILSVKKGYGVQAADFDFRINRDWDKVKDEVFEILNEPLLRDYLDENELDNLINDIKENEYHVKRNSLWAASQIGSLGYFLRDNI